MEELWIGLNDLKLQMNFEWSDGSLVSFTHWHPFEPNNFRDSLEDCVTIWGPVRTLSPYHSAPRPSPPPGHRSQRVPRYWLLLVTPPLASRKSSLPILSPSLLLGETARV